MLIYANELKGKVHMVLSVDILLFCGWLLYNFDRVCVFFVQGSDHITESQGDLDGKGRGDHDDMIIMQDNIFLFHGLKQRFHF